MLPTYCRFNWFPDRVAAGEKSDEFNREVDTVQLLYLYK